MIEKKCSNCEWEKKGESPYFPGKYFKECTHPEGYLKKDDCLYWKKRKC